MAAPFKCWILRRVPALLSRFATTTEILGGKTAHRLRVNQHTSQLKHARLTSWTGTVLFGDLKPDSEKNPKPSNESGNDTRRRPLKLMEFDELILPSPMKTIRNKFFSFLIKCYFDQHFTTQGFLHGSEQGVYMVSDLISRGQFSELDGLVTREAQHEIERHFRQLSGQQQQSVAVNPKDIFFRYIHEIGIILDNKTNERFVEITAVFQGIHGLNDAMVDAMKRNMESLPDELKQVHDRIYVCNYRFVREYTKGKEDDWIINKLNHFMARDH